MARTRPRAASPFRFPAAWTRPLRLEALEDRTTPAGGTVFGSLFLDADNSGTFEFNESIGGPVVFLDADGDGVLDADEVSDAAGGGFFNLSTGVDGVYQLTIVPTADYSALPVPVDLSNDAFLNQDLAVGLASGGIVRGTLFADADLDGVLDAGETGFASETVFVDANGNRQFDFGEEFTSTEADGTYVFALPGDRTVEVFASRPFVGGLGVTATSANPLTLALAGGADRAADFGFGEVVGQVSVFSFYDLNTDGQFSTGDVGSATGAATRVYADLNGNEAFDPNEPDFVPAPGSFDTTLRFTSTGTFTVRAVPAAGNDLTTPAAVAVEVTDGGFDNAQFGFRLTAGGYVRGALFYDADNDGSRDAGEPNLTGTFATVFIDPNADGTLDPTEVRAFVDSAGVYTLPTPGVDGTYDLRLIPPSGGTLSLTTAQPLAVAVAGGGVVTGADFGLRGTTGGLVTGSVFNDLNGDGDQDAGEGVPPAGVFSAFADADDNRVWDFSEAGGAVAADGTYAFVRLADGPVRVRLTEKGQGGFGGFDRAAVQTTADPADFDLTGGGGFPVAAFGARLVTGVRGTVFDDLDGDGTQDFNPAEPGLAGVTVYADLDGDRTRDPGEPSAVSGAAGQYVVDVGTPGTYTVRAEAPAGRAITTTNFSSSVQADRVTFGPTFGLFEVAGTIAGRVVLDANRNGALDPVETGGASFSNPVMVFADADNDGVLDAGERTATASTTFGADNGTFTLFIPAAAPGDYVVRIVPAAGLVVGDPAAAVTVSGGAAVTLPAPLAYTRVGGTVSVSLFADRNGNGFRDSSEPQTAPVGVQVFADLNGNAAFDAGEPTATTSQFSSTVTMTIPADQLVPVRVVAPTGFSLAPAGPYPVFVAAGGSEQAQFGLRQTAGGTVTGTVFYDADGDGTRDAGEPASIGFSDAPALYLDLDDDGVQDAGEPSTSPAPDGTFSLTTPAVNGLYGVRVNTSTRPQEVTTPEPATVVVTGGASADTGPIGFRRTTGGVVAGSVFVDTDGNGVLDAGEVAPGFGVVAVYDDANDNGVRDTAFGPDFEPSASINADGTFLLVRQGNGDARVRLTNGSFDPDAPPQFTLITTNPDPVAVAAGSLATVPAFGIQTRTYVRGTVFDDLDGDGTRDFDPVTFQPTEPVLPGVTVYADLDEDGQPDAGEPSDVTDADGEYLIELAGGGSFFVRAVVPAGRVVSTGTGFPTFVTAGQIGFGPFIGLVPVAGTISGVVFEDTDGDAQQDAGEPAGDFVRVFADADADGVLDDGERTAVTDAAGAYTISILLANPGDYTVRLDPASGRSATTPLGDPVTVGGGNANTAAPIGLLDAPVVGGTVFVSAYLDVDQDGTRDDSDLFFGSQVVVYADLDNDGVLDDGEPRSNPAQFQNSVAVPTDGTFALRAVTPAGYTLTSAETVTVTFPRTTFETAEFGFRPNFGGFAAGTVYYDADADGVRDAGEVAFAGANVFLDANGDGFGNESSGPVREDGTFTAAAPAVDGTYTLRADSRSNAFNAFAQVGTVTAVAGPVPLTGGQLVGGQDVGVFSPTGGLVVGSLFRDLDGDGTRDAGEDGLPSGSVTAYDDTNDNGILDGSEEYGLVRADGTFAFIAPGNGTHRIRFVGGSGPFGANNRVFVQTTTNPAAFDLADGAVRAGVTGGGRLLTVVRGSAFDDLDGDGTRDFGTTPEPGLAGVTVYADVDLDGVQDAGEPTATTDADGAYQLDVGTGGTYTLRVVPPAGRVGTNDPGAVTVQTDFVSFLGGFALRPGAGTITGAVFADADQDGVRDAGEVGLAGVVAFADADGDGALDAGEPQATSTADGSFAIPVLTAGTYPVRIVVPTNGTRTTANPADVTVTSGASVAVPDFGVFTAAPTTPTVSIAGGAVAEGDAGPRDLVFTVTRGGNAGVAVAVNFATADGTAVAGTDYTATTGTVAFAVGEVTKEVRVAVLGNSRLQGSRAFTVVLSAGSDPVSITGGAAVGTITDDDAAATAAAVPGTTPQTAPTGTPFLVPLAVEVRNAAGTPVQGVTVTFAAPAGGAGGAFAGVTTVTTGADGRAVAPAFTANATQGAYTVTATAAGGLAPAVSFALTNTSEDVRPNTPPTLSGLPPAVVRVDRLAVPPPITITVADAQTPAGELVVTVVPTGGGTAGFTAQVTGTGATRTITFTRSTAAGGNLTDFRVTVTDAGGLAAEGRFTLAVSAAVVPPPVTLVGTPQFAAGADRGGTTVTVYNPNGTTNFTATPFPGTAGGVRTVVADFTGDGVPEVAVGTGPGSPARVLILDTTTGATIFSKDVFDGFLGGVFVSAGDIDGDGRAELFVTPDEGGGPRVVMFRGRDFSEAPNFFGIDDPNFRGGARTAVGDMNADGIPDLLVAAGFGGGPRVAVFDGAALRAGRQVRLFGDVLVFEDALRNGVYLTVGDLDGDGFGDLIAGGGPGGGPRILALSGADLLAGKAGDSKVLANFFGGDVNNRAGIRLAVKNLDNDDRADLVVGPGAGAGGKVTTYLGKDLSATASPSAFDLDALGGLTSGVFVG